MPSILIQLDEATYKALSQIAPASKRRRTEFVRQAAKELPKPCVANCDNLRTVARTSLVKRISSFVVETDGPPYTESGHNVRIAAEAGPPAPLKSLRLKRCYGSFFPLGVPNSIVVPTLPVVCSSRDL